MRHLGLDLGATYIKWVVLEGDEITADGRLETRAAEGPDGVIGRLVAAGHEAGPVDTVGIGVPGLFDAWRLRRSGCSGEGSASRQTAPRPCRLCRGA